MYSSLLAAIAAFALGFPGAAAAQPRALAPFTVTALDGTAVDGQTLELETTWLLVHVQPRCGPCDALLERLASDERPAAARIVVIGAGMDAEAVARLSAKYPTLAASRWFADPDRGFAEAMAVKAAPTVFGLRRAGIEWRLAGSVADEKQLDSILFSWLEKP